jgi:hypothetical protein
MRRCRRRSLTWHQHHAIWYALMGEREAGEEPWRNVYTRETDNCEIPEQLVRMGHMRLREVIHGYQYYRVTEAGASAVGLWLPYE